MKIGMVPMVVLKIIAIILLFWGLKVNPYFFYQIQRWLISVFMIYCAYHASQDNERSWVWIFGIIAVLFNPIAPIYLNRQIWSVIDVVSALILFVSIFKSKAIKQP